MITKRPKTADDFANQLLAQDGYFVVSSWVQLTLGQIIQPDGLFTGPIVILSETTKEEYLRQGDEIGAELGECRGFYYRAVAE